VLKVVQVGIDVRKLVLYFFRQVLGIPDPAAGLAGTGRLVMSQMPVKRFDQLDALA
jgi:hypothetical protein